MSPLTDVIFRIWPKSEGGDVIALFPGDPGTSDPATCSSYQHVGQHGSATPDAVVERTRLAKPEEYAALKRELESAPYNYRLRVVKRCTPQHRAARAADMARQFAGAR